MIVKKRPSISLGGLYLLLCLILIAIQKHDSFRLFDHFYALSQR